jgi:hypothetical protein
LRKISGSFETIGLLHQSGNNEITEDLTQGLLRFEKGDWEGAIKFFRKVVEAFRHIVQKEQPIEGSKNRAQAIQDFLSKSFGLLSNFGEHYGTHGAFQDAALARDLAIAISKFLTERRKDQ